VSRIVYLDCSSGASGDMLLGALVDLGLSLDALRAELSKLGLKGYHIDAHKVHRSGLHATKVDVVDEHDHGHDHGHAHGHGHDHGHRKLREILDLVDKSALEPAVKDRSARLFRRLAEAEAAVHGTSPEEVHFHEVGALDSIVDIVGGVVGLSWLHADRVVASPLNVGTGTVSMSHGVFSVPPPATALLVQGVPVYGAGEGELLTPTGALLVTGHASAYGPLPALRSEGVGHGAGSRDTPGRPNVLRLIVGEEVGTSPGQRVVVLEAEMDDLSPQLCGPLLEKLFAAGALDVYYTAIQMKKGRPGILVTALVEPGRREAAEEVLFAEATTLGVRRQEWERTVLDREIVTVETPYGPVGVKVGRRGGRIYNAQPEFDDCERAAAARGVAVKEVWAAAVAAYRTRHPNPS
jgi:pyridinium-3,5-bisthiocarboxylic acid mononucleotide nickel chelatase